MEEEELEYVLVPLGLMVMGGYHLWLLYQIRNRPLRTVIGINAINRDSWVRSMMEDTQQTGVLAVQTLTNHIMASTVLASTAIMLSSLIAVLMTGGATADQHHSFSLTFGVESKFRLTIKFFSILACFLVAFLLNVQSIRYFNHASMLINVPYRLIANYTSHRLTAEYVALTVNRGSYFWSLGLRAFYFSFPLFLWLFGAIPMFVCSFVLVFLLYFLDVTFNLGGDANATQQDEETG